ncbi:MAG: hypothetical protein ACM3Q1_18825 [Bacteroidales bacterium]
MASNSSGKMSALAAMAAAKQFFDTIPNAYGGREHLGATMRALDELVLRLATSPESDALTGKPPLRGH